MKVWLAWGGLLAGVVFALAACGPGGVFEDSSARATRESQDNLYLATVQSVQTQASTIEALRATADSAAAMATQVVRINAQNSALEATIDALALGITQPVNTSPLPPAAQPGGTLSGSNQLFPNANNPTPTIAPPALPASGVTILDATTALAVSDDTGCALDRTTIFEPTEDQIYMVIQAQNIEMGTLFSTRWLFDNQNRFDTVTWTADQFYAELCIWFYVTQEDMVFQPGLWTVQFLANRSSVVSQTFEIRPFSSFNPVATEDF